MVNGIRTIYLSILNKGFFSKFCVGFQIRYETPEKGRRTHRPKRCEYTNEDSSPMTISDKK